VDLQKLLGPVAGAGRKAFEDAELVTILGGRSIAMRRSTISTRKSGRAQSVFKVFIQAYDIIDREYWAGPPGGGAVILCFLGFSQGSHINCAAARSGRPIFAGR